MNEQHETEIANNSNGTDRRLVIKASMATLAAIGAGGFANLANATQAKTVNDTDILNFALNLEYLEAEYYLRAVYGTGLSADETTGTGTQGQVNGGSMVPFKNQAIAAYAMEIANDERAHVDFLRGALGAKAVAEPTIDLQNSFNTLAKAAGLGDTFNPFESEANFLIGAFIFEDVGVTAYHGAASLIQSKTYLDAAAGILAVEAYHAGIIRLLCTQASLGHQAASISHLRNRLTGIQQITDQGIYIQNSDGTAAHNLVPTGSNGIAFERTTDQVLNIVYAGGRSGDFGFFPDKVNGKIR